MALPSVIFLDNDPVHRNTVRAALPQVMVPELPMESTEWPRYLKHVWSLDTYWITEDAEKRASRYQEHVARERVRANTASFSQFLQELGLQVSIEPATEQHLPRLFELLNRVTQFNFNGHRLTESQILELMTQDQGACLVVQVEDRFGDYGLVGMMLSRYEVECCTIDSFLLSCRALNRGVEHQMLRAVGRLALSHQKHRLRFAIAKTARNTPARRFLNALGMTEHDLGRGWFEMESSKAAEYPDIAKWPSQDFEKNILTNGKENQENLGNGLTQDYLRESERILEATISTLNIHDLPGLVRQVGTHGDRKPHNSPSEPRTEVETQLLDIFKTLLGHDHIGLHEEFFDAGGHSLLAMRLLSRVRENFNVDLPIRLLFSQNLTIANLASLVEAGSTPEENTADLGTIKQTLDSFSDDEIAELFGDLEITENGEN